MDDATSDFTEASGLVESLQPKPKRVRKPAAKKKAVKKAAKPKAKPKAKKKAVKKAAKKTSAGTRSQRLDFRLTKAEKAKLTAKAKATRRTITSVVLELIEKMR